MWYSLGKWILKNRLPLLILLFIATGIMTYFASKVQLSYEFTRAIPTDNIKYQEYEQFKQRFGGDGNVLVIGLNATNYYELSTFNAFRQLQRDLKTVKGVESILSIPDAVTITKGPDGSKLVPVRIFNDTITTQAQLDSSRAVFENLPFYRGLLYNPDTKAYLTGINVNKEMMNSKARSGVVADIMQQVQKFESATGLELHASGLPFIRTTVGDLIKAEMRWFLIGSLILSAITLLLFFRSASAVIMSLLVVIMGVIWSLALMVLFGYKITLLTALIPPLIVVIGVPNCIYFLNKYHSSYRETGEKNSALVTMVGRMGIVTLFCNIAAAIGFAVFALTKSALLKEFGAVAGINIMLLFVISLIFIPAVLSYLPPPRPRELKYLDNKLLIRALEHVERWTLHHKGWVYGITLVVTAVAMVGIFRLKSEGYIVDDLPKTNKIYTDLKWFESNFKGVMPLEIMVDTKARRNINLETFQLMDEFSQYISTNPNIARPLSLVEALKFGNQAYYDGDSMSYTLPITIPSLTPLLRKADSANTGINRVVKGFIDTSQQYARISVNMKDVGSLQLPVILDSLETHAKQIFDTSAYRVQFTGATVTFLEGSRFIINGLKESVLWAFLLIALCMLYLFKSFKILVCSLIPNVVPLVITAGVMGWAGIALKPSTVLVFSVALGIAIDVTIRFLINYKQELPENGYEVEPTLIETIRHTGISIIYTSLVLIAGFVIFCFSGFGGTKALGWLTSLTLVVGTITNLVLLPVLLLLLGRRKRATPMPIGDQQPPLHQ
ncbi:RND transporter [Segetibacter sp. 3557_3]|uniref:efflux RND transporter permease subunit n=1 Tax=Segetibacter sp. 3557_3 TaxID=2547429 RepID=UPI0010587255|nr:MMPL family transporter [Segetibacter sp. 3557_3]TDH24053.1 RND transporter [Segetibacter sp. 3557_3]